MLAKLSNENKNLNLNKKNMEKLNSFLVSLLKSNITNKGTFYQGLNSTSLTNTKVVKLIALYFNTFLKYIIDKIFWTAKILIILILELLTIVMKFIVNLFFNKIIKIKIFRSKIQNLFPKILYYKQISAFIGLIRKRKQSVNPDLRETNIKLIQKANFKKLLIEHVERVRKIKLTKRHKYMLKRKVKKKRIINKNLRSSRLFVSENFIKFLEFENNAFIFTNNLSNTIVSVLSKIKFILRNSIYVLRMFEKNKKINYARKIAEYILNKSNLFSKYLNVVSKQLNTIKNLNKLFKFLFVRNFMVLRSGKKSGKIYFKSFQKYYFFNSFLLIFSLLKVILLASIISENKTIKILAKKIDIFLNLDTYIKQFITNIRFI